MTLTRSFAKYAKEALAITCEYIIKKATTMLDWDKFAETSGNLTQGERDCLKQLLPQLRIAAKLFRQGTKNKEKNDG